MRTTPDPFEQPLVIPPKAAPDQKPVETWTPVERGSVIERNQDGKVRTNIPENNSATWKPLVSDELLHALDAWQC